MFNEFMKKQKRIFRVAHQNRILQKKKQADLEFFGEPEEEEKEQEKLNFFGFMDLFSQ